MERFGPMWLLQARRVLQEIHRIHDVMGMDYRYNDDKLVWDSLVKTPEPPLPGTLVTLLSSPFHPRQRPYGLTFTVRADSFIRDANEHYYAIMLPSGRIALVFPPFVPEMTSIVNRFAVNRLFEENGWRFPTSLGIPEALAALGEMLTCGGRRYAWNPAPPDVVPKQAFGDLLLVDPKSTTPKGHLRWTPRRLWFELDD